ncbi:glucose-1-phosphate-thymidylyltransferase [Alishewanella agri BL06]|uniref:Glucose-1-phosphate thymidylyltransferase n=1 Tax=Alishewanella agri BL06 TaxID=1195246 RepID=I8UAK2_9ALTE|nr:glucose-1-phosphate thymidylyltransferase RfbA [Alishewanella agri]EIW90271.1 glucose-1-phosphate-thymidylyltransferase [Alishewanella agri BL06]
MKGILLAGGTGSRLFPITLGISKQLLPIHNKPMIYYSLSVLMLAGIRDILLITTSDQQAAFQRLLGDGSKFGISLQYAVQHKPEGIAQAFLIAEKFIGNDEVCLVLGDNIFYGEGFTPKLHRARSRLPGAVIFGYQVKDPERFGVVKFDSNFKVQSIEEKPIHPQSKYAVTGLYFYDNQVVDITKSTQPSARGELEITSVNQIYLSQQQLQIELLGRGFAWLDTGTHESLSEASTFVETIEKRQGYQIACLEEIAHLNGWLSKDQVITLMQNMPDCGYKDYLAENIINKAMPLSC